MDKQQDEVMLSPGGGSCYLQAILWLSRIYSHVRGSVMHFWATTFPKAPPPSPPCILIDRSLKHDNLPNKFGYYTIVGLTVRLKCRIFSTVRDWVTQKAGEFLLNES